MTLHFPGVTVCLVKYEKKIFAMQVQENWTCISFGFYELIFVRRKHGDV